MKPDLPIYWCDGLGVGRNEFCLMRRRFEWEGTAVSCRLRIFVDSRYRLSLNGHVVGCGPARFHPGYPEFDEYDLSPFLAGGENCLLVEAHYPGAPNYQSAPSRGGVWITGSLGSEQALDLPDGWEALRSRAWDPEAEPFSFAQGPVEILDRRVLEAELAGGGWGPPVKVAGAWGEPAPRVLPRSPGRAIIPRRIVTAAPLANGRTRLGCRFSNPDFPERRAFATHIYSPVAQTLELGLFWGPVGINGRRLEHEVCGRFGNREVARVQLHAGWNFLFGLPEALQPFWAWHIDLPCGSGVWVRAMPQDDCPHTFLLSGGPVDAARYLSGSCDFPVSLAECGIPESSWIPWPGGTLLPSPAREAAWDQPASGQLRGIPWVESLPLAATDPDAAGYVLCLDMGREYLGYPFVEIEGDGGLVVDFAYDERLSVRGTAGLFESHPFVNSADRIVHAGGRAVLRGFHERGGRYFQVTLRGPAGSAVVHGAGISTSTWSPGVEARFACSEPLFDWIWETGVRTIEGGLGDGMIDSPWRERGVYLGDNVVSLDVLAGLAPDRGTAAWTLRLFARAQLDDGQIPAVTPSTGAQPLLDYNFLFVEMLRNHWRATGDTGLVSELWPVVARIFASPVWREALPGVLEVPGGSVLFLDWGCHDDEKSGLSAALNTMRIRAYLQAAELRGALGDRAGAAAFRTMAGGLTAAFREAFWLPGERRFACSIRGGKPSGAPSYHANTLAVDAGAVPPGEMAAVLDYIAKGLYPGNGPNSGAWMELFYLHFALPVLCSHGRFRAAEDALRRYYAPMRERGLWALPETFSAGFYGADSMCHAWSTSPLRMFAGHTLGVQTSLPGEPDEVFIAPASDSLRHASGRVLTRLGVVGVGWKIDSGRLHLAVEVPDGVRWTLRPGGNLAGLEVVERPGSPVLQHA